MATPNAPKPKVPSADAQDRLKELAILRKEVSDLRSRLAEIHGQSDVDHLPVSANPWLKIAATVGVTFALGKIIRVLRLPTATAVAIPMITAEVNRRFL